MTSASRVAKDALIRLLARYHREVRYSPPDAVCGIDLQHDLRALVSGRHPVCLDVGANAGQTIDMLQRTLDAPIIHAFEPSTAMMDGLRARAFGARVFLHQLALGRQREQREFHNYDRPDLSSFLPLTANADNPFRDVPLTGMETVEVDTVDRFVGAQGLDHVDLLKVDTQGFDAEVIAGARESLASGCIRAVLVELNFVRLYDGQSSALDIQSALADAGLAPVGLYEVIRRNHVIAWCTALFARPATEPHDMAGS
jgi:FkbM family methyltransferase